MKTMNAAQIHLGLNHLPVVSMLIGALVLLAGHALRQPPVRMTALAILIFAGLSSVPTFLSGEPSEDLIEDRPGISKKMIHEHEEAADFALTFSLIFLFLVQDERENSTFCERDPRYYEVLVRRFRSKVKPVRFLTTSNVLRHSLENMKDVVLRDLSTNYPKSFERSYRSPNSTRATISNNFLAVARSVSLRLQNVIRI